MNFKCPFLQKNKECTKKRPNGHSYKKPKTCHYTQSPEKCPHYQDWVEILNLSEKLYQIGLKEEYGLLGDNDEI